MAAEDGDPVVISCTGATASRNYLPGLTEAFYRKLPILAVTANNGLDNNGHLVSQYIDRTVIPNDVSTLSVAVPAVHDKKLLGLLMLILIRQFFSLNEMVEGLRI